MDCTVVESNECVKTAVKQLDIPSLSLLDNKPYEQYWLLLPSTHRTPNKQGRTRGYDNTNNTNNKSSHYSAYLVSSAAAKC